MPLLRDKAPKPLPSTRRPAYPRVLEIGALLLLSACSRSNSETPQEVPPPPHPGGAAPVLMTDAEAPPPPPVPMGSVATPITEAGAPDAGIADGGKDAGKKVSAPANTRPPRTGGVPPHPFDGKEGF